VSAKKKPILRFPALDLPHDHYYQLVHVGCFRFSGLIAGQQYVLADFLPVCGVSAIPLPEAQPIQCEFHVHQARFLKVGSLWDPTTGQLIAFAHQLLPQRLTFAFGQTRLRITTLEQCFPDFGQAEVLHEIKSFLPAELLAARKAMTFARLTQDAGSPTIIIPCFEILRALLFWTGKKLTDRFFAPPPLPRDALCQLVTKPEPGNAWNAEVVLWGKGYTPAQAVLLSALECDEKFSSSFTRARSKMISTIQNLVAPDGLREIYPQVEFELDQSAGARQVVTTAHGISFRYNGHPYFWVCSIDSWKPFFAFNTLSYVHAVDNRAANPGQDEDQATVLPVNEGAKRPQFHSSASSNPVSDSTLPGHALAAAPADEWDVGDDFALPAVAQKAKLVDKVSYHVEYQHITLDTEAISGESGGSDPTIAIETTRDRPAPDEKKKEVSQEELDFQKYFSRLLDLLRQEKIDAHALTLNADNDAVQLTLSCYPNQAVKLGVAHLTCESNYHFYFFEVLSGRRAALVFSEDLTPLDTSWLNNILNVLWSVGGSWTAFRDFYTIYRAELQSTLELSAPAAQRRIPDGLKTHFAAIPVPLIVRLRNHLKTQTAPVFRTSEAITADRCLQNIRSAIQNRKSAVKPN
jgi:hypothetical protein